MPANAARRSTRLKGAGEADGVAAPRTTAVATEPCSRDTTGLLLPPLREKGCVLARAAPVAAAKGPAEAFREDAKALAADGSPVLKPENRRVARTKGALGGWAPSPLRRPCCCATAAAAP